MPERETLRQSPRADHRADLVAAYLSSRPGRRGSIAERRQHAAAEAELAGALNGRYIADDGTEFTRRGDGTIKMQAPPEAAVDRDVRRAERYGYTADDGDLWAIGQEIKQAVRELSREEMDALRERYREQLQTLLAEDEDLDADDELVERYAP